MKERKARPKFIEVEGKTLDQAIEKALKILGVPKSMVDIKLLSEEEKGLFGMQGSQPAKIQVSIKGDVRKNKP
jgi:spoIIIJ-associated protein